MTMNRIIFGAPFGNYYGGAHITRTLGTFTTQKRAGWLKRWWRVLKTVRYSPSLKAWVNKLGLPSPGIDWLLKRQHRMKGTIVSLHGFSTMDWLVLVQKLIDAAIPEDKLPLFFELNFSCPNVKDDPIDYAMVIRRMQEVSTNLIVKLPPVQWQKIARASRGAGVTWFHCCNTLPVPAGGMSGKPLKPVVLQMIPELRADLGSDVTVIAGGGITNVQDINDYAAVGASYFAVASALFFPWNRWRMRHLAVNIAAASWEPPAPRAHPADTCPECGMPYSSQGGVTLVSKGDGDRKMCRVCQLEGYREALIMLQSEKS